MISFLVFVALRENILQTLSQLGLPPDILVLIISTLPIFELRGAIPVGINYLGLSWIRVLPIAIIGNLIPVPLLLLIFHSLVQLGEKIPFLNKILRRTEQRGRVIEKYKMFGLIIFVGIPLPITGAWTGALAAGIFGIPFYKAMIGIVFGVLIAAIIVTTLSLLGIWGAIIAGIVLFALLVRKFIYSR